MNHAESHAGNCVESGKFSPTTGGVGVQKMQGENLTNHTADGVTNCRGPRLIHQSPCHEGAAGNERGTI